MIGNCESLSDNSLMIDNLIKLIKIKILLFKKFEGVLLMYVYLLMLFYIQFEMKGALRPSFSLTKYLSPVTATSSDTNTCYARDAAKLAKLRVRDIDSFEKDITKMLAFASLLKDVDTENVESLEVFADGQGIAKTSLPKWERVNIADGMIMVPKVLEKE